MIILVALIAIVVAGVLLARSYDYYIWGALLVTIFGLYLFFHVLFWSMAGYNYNIMAVQRESFVETLNDARKNSNPLELAAITKEVAEWNKNLAESKYNATVFLLSDYVDSRIKDLKPIR